MQVKTHIRKVEKMLHFTYHLKGIFLSFQKIVEIESTEFKLWRLKESPNH